MVHKRVRENSVGKNAHANDGQKTSQRRVTSWLGSRDRHYVSEEQKNSFNSGDAKQTNHCRNICSYAYCVLGIIELKVFMRSQKIRETGIHQLFLNR